MPAPMPHLMPAARISALAQYVALELTLHKFRYHALGGEILQDFSEAFGLAFALVLSGDADLFKIVALSLRVSLSATAWACLIGLPLGALVAVTRFRGRGAVLILSNALMGLPPVVVGLIVYLHLSRAGPLGFLGLLYTPTAMIIAQTILITPIVMALSRQVFADDGRFGRVWPCRGRSGRGNDRRGQYRSSDAGHDHGHRA